MHKDLYSLEGEGGKVKFKLHLHLHYHDYHASTTCNRDKNSAKKITKQILKTSVNRQFAKIHFSRNENDKCGKVKAENTKRITFSQREKRRRY